MKLTLRLASEVDASAIAALVNRAYRPLTHERGWTHEADLVSGDRTSPEQVLSLFEPRSTILLLCRGSALVACVHLQNDHSCVYIGMLATDPSIQAQGIGKQLLSQAEQYATERFGISVFKMSVLSSRLELMAFYERRGYVRTGTVESYPTSVGIGQPKIEGLQVVALIKEPANPSFNRMPDGAT